MHIPWLEPDQPGFPAPATALDHPNGLLAAGGDLSPAWLLLAYRNGIFPWFSEGEPILWWSPDPRGVLYTNEIKLSRSLLKRLRQQAYSVHVDRDFAAVIRHCSEPRPESGGTWITQAMQQAYLQLHSLGYAHSIECYADDELVGGLYGVSLGRLFFGESMFHLATDASKVALAHLTRLMQGFGSPLIDCQMVNDHLATLGVRAMRREDFLQVIADHGQPAQQIDWRQIPSALPAW